MAFNWFRSYTTEWDLVPVDPVGWVEQDPLARVKSFRFATNGDDDVPLLQSGSFTIDTDDLDPSPGWYKIKGRLIASTGEQLYYPLGVLLCESDDMVYDYGIGTVTMSGKSVLLPAKTRSLRDGSYIPKGSSGAQWCRRVLSDCTPAPVEIADGEDFTVNRNYVFDSATTTLKAVWNVLDKVKWVIQIDGDGVVTLMPKPKRPSFRFEGDVLSLFKPGLDRTVEQSNVPNVYICRYGNRKVTVVNDDPGSPVSTVVRGYEKEEYDSDPVLSNGEEIEHYAKRMLESMSTLIRSYTYDREVWEDIAPYDLAYFNMPGYTGEARIMSQSFSMNEGGIQVNETIAEEVKLWEMD